MRNEENIGTFLLTRYKENFEKRSRIYTMKMKRLIGHTSIHGCYIQFLCTVL